MGADTAGFGASVCLASIATAFGAGAGAVASRATGDGAGVPAAVTLAGIVETFTARGVGVETGAMGPGASDLLASILELIGAFFSGGLAGDESSAPVFAAGDFWFFLVVSFTEFVFIFKRRLFLAVELNNSLLASIPHRPDNKAEKVKGSNNNFFATRGASVSGNCALVISRRDR